MDLSGQIMDVAEVLLDYSEKQLGATSKYQTLLKQLEESSQLTDHALLAYLRSIRSCVSNFGSEHGLLVTILINIEWTTRNAAVVKEYQSLVLNLISAKPMYLTMCLEMIVDQLSLRSKSKDKSKRLKVNVTNDADHALHQQSFSYLHELLLAIVNIVPMTAVVLVPLIHMYFPFVRAKCYVVECYVENLLKITLYIPARRCEILKLIVERMVAVDLNAPRDQVQLMEDNEDDSNAREEQFTVDDVKTGRSNSSTMRHVEGQKLDTVMNALLSYIHSTCHNSSGELNWDATRTLYRDLLAIFDSVLLPTHATSHVQFIMFYICSLRSALADGFIDYLWKKATNPNLETVFRQSAIAYVSSFLARAKYVPITCVRICLDRMADWTHRYIAEAAYTSTRPDARHHGAFYAVCQAIFYCFVFRHRSLLESPGGVRFCKSLNLPTIVNSRLNPLHVCHPKVTETFASVSRASQIAFCDTIIERNKRSKLPEVDGANGGHNSISSSQLILYFPFDPYILTQSSRFFVGLYQEYEGGGTDGDVGRGGNEETEAMEEELYTDHGNTNCDEGTVSARSESFGSSRNYLEFFKHGRSPGFNREITSD